MIRPLAVALLALPLHAAETPFWVAHRGASSEAPENTLPAFELAWKQGADAIEGDFHLSKDGHIVCIHDKDTKRIAGVKKSVRKTTLGELRTLDAGSWHSPQFRNTRIPTFPEVAATVPEDKVFYVEIKCGPEIVPALLAAIETSPLRSDQIRVISFDAKVIRSIEDRSPGLKTYWLSSFSKKRRLDPSSDQTLAILSRCKADGFSSKADPRIDRDYISKIKRGGFEYHCWTIDEPELARRFLTLGAQSITTNRPGFLRSKVR